MFEEELRSTEGLLSPQHVENVGRPRVHDLVAYDLGMVDVANRTEVLSP